MIPRECVINKLRELGYQFQDRKDRVEMYRKKGGTHMVVIPHRKLMTPESAASLLRQCLESEEEIQKFIGQNQTH